MHEIILQGIGSVQKKSWFKAASASILFAGSSHNNLSIWCQAYITFSPPLDLNKPWPTAKFFRTSQFVFEYSHESVLTQT